MEYFKQGDLRWAGIPLGVSPYKMGPYGCLTTAHAQALALAGYATDPGKVVTALNAAGAYTGPAYVLGAGLLLWGKVHDAFPEYHWHPDSSAPYKFVQVILGSRQEHWLLQHDGLYYDPLTGLVGDALPSAYRTSGVARSADIDPAPVPVHAFPKEVNLIASAYVRTSPDLTPGNVVSQKVAGHDKDWLTIPFSFVAVDIAHGQSVAGSDLWLKTERGHWVWAKNTDYKPNES